MRFAADMTMRQFAVLLGALLFLTFPGVFLGVQTFVVRDFGFFAVPNMHYLRECWQNGQLPLWNPYSYCGLPFLAQWNTLCLYPLTPLVLMFPLTWALPLFCLAHQYLGGIAMYALVRRWTGSAAAAAPAGIVYAFGGIMLGALMWPGNAAVLGLMPLVVLLVDAACRAGGQAVVWAALAGAMQMLTGSPEFILATWLLAGLTFFRERTPVAGNPWRWGQRFMLICLLVAGLTAVQLLPFLDFVANSQRHAQFNDSQWSLPLWGWGNLLVPKLYTYVDPQGYTFPCYQNCLSSVYCGLLPLLLAGAAVTGLASRWLWLLAGASLAALWFSFGQAGGLFQLLTSACPALGFSRYPVKAIVVCGFAIPVMMGYALACLFRAGRPDLPSPRRLWAAILAFTGIGLLLMVYVVTLERLFPIGPDPWMATLRNAGSRAAFLGVALVLLVASTTTAKDQTRGLLRLLLILVLWLDFRLHLPSQNPTVTPQAYAAPVATRVPEMPLGTGRLMISMRAHAFINMANVETTADAYRLARDNQFANTNLLDPRPKIDGFYALVPGAIDRMVGWLYAAPANNTNANVLDYAGVRYVAGADKLGEWQPRLSAMPLIAVGQKPVVLADAQVRERLTNPAFNPRSDVILAPEAAAHAPADACPGARVLGSQWRSHRITAEVDFPQAGILTLAQTYYPAWRATVDERPVAIWRANGAFQAVVVPAGRHTVRLAYRDMWFSAGAVISTLTAALLTGWWLLQRRRGTPEGGTPQA